ncbi:Ger(x)C family spore germination protein [Virgibacillus alimentarius]|uniref:Spore germination protein n=1 Tax=Virgibacillus alimentarius TaxID=698769 RepID=A0ABS4S895_9BACI|nr:Ger(x)C family spore germination protein [Virgibacillus alimentarius]MBP2257712.1 spore germination protein [Virgibacillus alimentarius]
MVKQKLIQITTYFLMVILLTGCWDQINIEEHGFVVGSAIDKANDYSDENMNLSLTNQIVSPAGLGTPAGGGNNKSPFVNVTATGTSIFTINRNMVQEISRAPFYEHVRLLIVSEEVAREPEIFASILDIFIRDQEMRRGIKIMIAKNKAKELLEIKPEPEQLPVRYLDMISDNNYKSIDMIDPVTLGNVHDFLLNNKSYVLPKISLSENEVDYKGAAVFHGLNDNMVAELTAQETKGMNLVKGDVNGGVIKFKVEDHVMTFELEGAKSKIKIDPKDPKNMDISVNVEVEGRLAEMYGSKTLLDPSYLSKIEEKVAKKIEKLANQTIDKAQKEMKLDIFDFDKILKQKHYSIWKRIKKDWEDGENYFANSRIDVSADVQIRETGATNRAKGKRHE